MKLLTRLKQALCSHAIYIEDLKRDPDGITRIPCIKCRKILDGDGGIAISTRYNCKLLWKSPQ